VVILQQQDLCTLKFSFTGTVVLSGKALFDIYSEKSVSNCGGNVSCIEFFVDFSVFGFAQFPLAKNETIFLISSRPRPYEFTRCSLTVFCCDERVEGRGGKRADLEVIYNLYLIFKIML
jgi:hypothetical protein